MNRLMITLFAAVLAASVAMPAASAQAQQGRPAPASGPSLVMSASNLTAAQAAARGAARRDSSALPGDVLRYTMVFTNTTAEAIGNVKLDNPLPGGLEYIAGSARASRPDVVTEFSADGGTTYAAQPMETVVVDGRRQSRPIPPNRYTHVRWVVRGSVPAGAAVSAEFSARVSDVARAARTPGNNAPARR